MKNLKILVLMAAFILTSFSVAKAQIWNSNAGGYNGGYGQVYQSFGLAQATIQMQQTTQMQIQKLMMQQAMEKKWGKEAVAKAQRQTGSSNSSSTQNSKSSQPVTTKSAPSKNYAYFQPIEQNNNLQIIADTIGTNAQEKELLKQVFAASKNAFNEEVKLKGRKYNLAASMTFFIASTLTVYHDAPEPTEEATENLFNALSQMIDETPEMINVPNKDKQFLHDTFISFSGLVLAGYLEAKQTNNKNSLKVYQQLAGGLLFEILKINPDKVKFEENTMKFER